LLHVLARDLLFLLFIVKVCLQIGIGYLSWKHIGRAFAWARKNRWMWREGEGREREREREREHNKIYYA